MTDTTHQPTRGDIYMADMGRVPVGSEQAGYRPVLIIQNDIGNRYSPTVIVAAITSKIKKALPVHVQVPSSVLGQGVIVLLEQIRTIDKSRLRQRIGTLDAATMHEVDRVIPISLGLEMFTGPDIQSAPFKVFPMQLLSRCQHAGQNKAK